MAAPSKSFTIITDARIDPDSPLPTGLLTDFRDNDIHMEEWLGLSFVAAQDHNHDGVNSALVTNASLVFDQATGGSASISTGGFNGITNVTVAAADLPINRDAMIICTGGVTSSGDVPQVRLVVAGVAKQTLDVPISALDHIFSISEIVNLASGSDRLIDIQGARGSSGTSTFANVNLFSVLIT